MLNPGPKEVNLRSTFIRGAGWSMAMRWSIKLLGLVSTVILARLLTPTDYGLVAMAMLIVGLVQVLIDFGADTNVLREQSLTKDIIDSAWTLRVIQGWIVASLLALSAPLAGAYFGEPNVVWIIWVISGGVLAGSFTNIGITVARKQFNFGLEYRFRILSKVIGVVVTVIAAFFLRDYRALIIGIVASYLFGLVLSYAMHPYRPAWNTSQLRSMWHFSKWLLISGIGDYLTRNSDQFIAGRIGSAHSLGIYNVAADIGQLPTAELGPPIMRTFLPALSAIKDDTNRVRAAVLKTLGAINTLTIPVAFGLATLAEPFTLLLLGSQWLEAIPFLAIFALVGAFRVMVAPFFGLLLLLGLSKQHAKLMWMEFLAFIIAAGALAPAIGVVGLAYARLISAGVFCFASLHVTKQHTGINYRDMAKVLWRPLASAAVMSGAILLTPHLTQDTFINLTLDILFGASTYTILILTSWWACERPDGIENLVVSKIFSRAR